MKAFGLGGWWKVCLVALLISVLLRSGIAAQPRPSEDSPPTPTSSYFPLIVLPAVDPAPLHSYYIDSVNGSDANAGTSPAEPWRSLAVLRSHTLVPGDAVNLARGSDWKGGLTIEVSGEPNLPITFRAYGTGPRPVVRGSTRGVVIQLHGQWVVLQDLLVRDAQRAGVDLSETSGHDVIRDMEATGVGVGMEVSSQDNLIAQNYVHDLHMVVNTPGGYDDWGAVGVILGSSNNDVSYNRFVNCRAQSYDYGYDGGGVEIFGEVDNSSIHHNYVQDSEGFVEVGGSEGATTHNIVVAYNLVINSGRVVGIHLGGRFATLPDNFRFVNNTVVDVRPEPLSNPFYLDDGVATPNMLIVRNNILYLNNFQRIMGESAAFTHDHNLYFEMTGPARLGFSLGPDEQIGDPHFVDVVAGDYHLAPGSPAIDAGAISEYVSDFDGVPVPNGSGVDLGAFEHLGQ